MSETNGKAKVTKDQLHRFEELVGNVMQSRSELFSRLFDPRRDINDECGYPSTSSLTADNYRDLFDRDPIANRVVNMMPRECWQRSPNVYESEDSDEPTDFEDAWDELGQSLAPNKSWFQDEKGSVVWTYLQRLDELSGIGQFGVLLLGIDDGKNLQDPVDGVEVVSNGRVIPDSPMGEEERKQRLADNAKQSPQTGESGNYINPREPSGPAKKLDGSYAPGDSPFIQGADSQYMSGMGLGMPAGAGLSGTDQQYFGVQFGPSEKIADEPSKEKRRLLFLRVFDESLVQIVRYEWNIRNPRFGLPVMYRITLNDPRQPHSGVGLPLATVYVHWSRVIHVADNLMSSEIFGVPRMRPVLNSVLDLRKVRGGSAEMYWRGAFPGLSIETIPQLGGDVEIDAGKLRDMMEDYMNGLQRYLTFMGMTAKTLAPQVVDPTGQVNIQTESICIQLGSPVRVFKGSERGELASTQDDSSWNDRIRTRQDLHITPRIICVFIDRLILLGILPEPEGYSVEWPDLDSLTDKDKAAIMLQRTQAYSAYIAGGIEAVVPPLDYMTDFDDMTEERATEMLKQSLKAQDAQKEQQEALADEHGFEPKPPPGFHDPDAPVPAFMQPQVPKDEEGDDSEEEEATENLYMETRRQLELMLA